MRIKKLELVGFKSFKDRTVIHFDEGITGIVGPNGCGKSNIVDALVWVMGEMSAKHLRGSSMEDVIFAGAEGYAPMGMCEVSLTLENDGGPFPAAYLRFSEIMVTRRLHRDGESEYFINKEPARLRDIQEIFMDTGAGAKGFSIIQQNAIGQMITAKPEDRRVLIEEAAGITKFKMRKRESQRKLNTTEQNTLRLEDIVSELRRQIDQLEKQAQKAQRYRELRSQIEDLDLTLSSRQYFEVLKTRAHWEEELKTGEASEASLVAETSESEMKLEVLRHQMADLETELTDHQLRHRVAQTQVQKLEAQIQELKFEIESARRNRETTGSLLMENEARREILERDLASVEERWTRAVADAEASESVLREKREVFESTQARIREADSEVTVSRRELLTLIQAESSLTAKVLSLEESVQVAEERGQDARQVLEELMLKRADFEARRNKISADFEHERQLQLELSQNIQDLKTQKVQVADQVATQKQEVDTLKDQLNEVTSLLYGLENLNSNYEGFQEGVRSILFWQRERLQTLPEEEREKQPRYVPVSEVVEVPAQYELALEAALGPRLQMLVAESGDMALSGVEYLKSQKTGRSSFLAASPSNPSSASVADVVVPQVRTVLRDVVNAPSSVQAWADHLLGRVGVVDSLMQAVEISNEFPDWTFVTLDGDVLSSDGVMTGGSAESADSGVLKRRREIKELSERKTEAAGKLALAQAGLQRLEEQLKSLEFELSETTRRGTEKEILVVGIKKDLERAENEVHNCQQAIQRQERDVQQLQSQIDRRREELDEIQERVGELRERKQELEQTVSERTAELESVRGGIDEMQSEVTSLQVRAATLRQEAEGITRERQMLRNSLEEVLSLLSRMQGEKDKSTESMSASQIQLEQQKVALEHSISEYEQIEEVISERSNEFELIQAQARDLERVVNEANSSRHKQLLKLNEAKLQAEQARLREENLLEQVRTRYILHLPDVAEKYRDREIPYADLKEAESELKILRERLTRMGDVNLAAIDEFDEVRNRYEFLNQQLHDLYEAKEQLIKVIDRIDKICSQRFKETFDLVNDRFTKVFPVLFGGGEAQLILVDDGKDANADDTSAGLSGGGSTLSRDLGIDIVAKPPGKKLQSISLLSGGEKALTAVSLIFSIFLVRPSPYCLLDEVDAPLDDANVFRFNDLVREMSKRSQIIVVTHNKYTMEVAQKLYGVTMEEKGVSKMVSVNLASAAG